MRKYLPRIGWEKFECFQDGDLIHPSANNEIEVAQHYRWAFVLGWGLWIGRAFVSTDVHRFIREENG